MKYFFLISLLFSFSVLADPLCDENGNPISSITELAQPNCLNEKYLGPAISENKTNDLCNKCKTSFQKFVKDPINETSKSERQDKFLEIAFKEYQKSLTENLFDVLKLRATRPTGSTLSKSIKSCQMKGLKEFTSSCASPKAIEFLKKSDIFNKFNESFSVELGKILATDGNYKTENTLLKRNKPACFIPEKDLLYISLSATEEVLTPKIINILSSIDPSKYETIGDLLFDEKLDGLFTDPNEISNIFSSLQGHPLLTDKMSSPSSAIAFFKSIKDPKDAEKLRELIYNKSNGDAYDKKLAQNCDDSFTALTKSICSADFENGNFSLNSFQNHQKLYGKNIKPTGSEYTTTPEIEKQNVDILKLCDNQENSKIQLSPLLSTIDKSLNPNYVEKTLEQYKTAKYEKDLANLNEDLCSRQNKECKENTLECKLLEKFKATKNPKSLDYKLANSSNEEVNKLLRSMIGDTSRIDVETKKILIAQGIIPKDDGTMVKQPDIPERQPEYFAKEQSQQPGQQQANTNVAKIGPSSSNSKAANNRAPANDNTYDDSYSNVNSKSTTSQSTGPDFSDLMDNQQELKNVQDEIKRRLLGSNGKPSEEEARKVVRDSFKSRKQPLSQEMEDSFTNRIMDNNATTPQAFANNSQTTTTDEPNRAQVSGGDSANAKWRKQQDQNALMGMAGAQQVLGKDSANSGAANADAKPKDLTKVALNLADDPRVNLSELFNKKIDQNDSETQLLKVLLRNKNNFLLQVKAMNFKVVFDEKNNFNVLLESGDKQEAARIRPQLEMFLKKLKS